ncbi:MAG: nuclear transport factor 2 family protein [Acidobacteriia bacterium]|nr:nuclear transport factor 2 family protein [Terriglobia bacterium]
MRTIANFVTAGFFLVLLAATGALGVEPQAMDEKAKIESTARDYIDGWYEASAGRMHRALHPDLAKRSFVRLPNGRPILETASAGTMVELTRAGFGKRKARPDQKNQVIVLDISGNMASVKTISPDYVDFLHMAKVDGAWKIVNVLWEPVEGKPPSP